MDFFYGLFCNEFYKQHIIVIIQLRGFFIIIGMLK